MPIRSDPDLELCENDKLTCVSEMAAGKSEQEGPKNPPYMDMIVAAIKADQSRTGTSKQVRGASCAGRAI